MLFINQLKMNHSLKATLHFILGKCSVGTLYNGKQIPQPSRHSCSLLVINKVFSLAFA